jgi:hypothetical protein
VTKQEFGINWKVNVRVAGSCQMMESIEGLSASSPEDASGFMCRVDLLDPGE